MDSTNFKNHEFLEFLEEENYLSDTLEFINKEIKKESGILEGQRKELVDANRTMWDETSRKKITYETISYLDYFLNTARVAQISDKQIKKYTSILSAPYFSRFDFSEEGFDDTEKIYIGYYNVMDTKNSKIYVYDWRAPISSIYYRFELGDCSYMSPQGLISGQVTLKRQYQIEKGELKFFFDSAIAIKDEILILALSQNSTEKMKNIVETIQKEQDIIIRDLSHHAVIVQGIAGSGKTSVALHRVAYLLYENDKTRLKKNNIIIISPNNVFSDYIEDVLPSLGEEIVQTITLDHLFRRLIKGVYIQPKNKMLELMVSFDNEKSVKKRQSFASVLCSDEFRKFIKSYADFYERRLHEFSDIVIGGKILFTRQELKALFLDNKANIPAEKRLNRIKLRVIEKAEQHYKSIYEKYKPIVYNNPKLRFEEERHLKSVIEKYRANFEKKLSKQMSINIIDVYKQTKSFATDNIQIKKVLKNVCKSLDNGFLSYEAATGVLYLKLILCGNKQYSDIKHTIIDEAQDYSPLHYHLFSLLFPESKFTVLGDINQTIGKDNTGIYEIIGNILGRGSASFVSLTKSYRSSREITNFTNKILGRSDYESVEREGEPPKLTVFNSHEEILKTIESDIEEYVACGYNQIAIITKSLETAKTVYENININTPKRLLGEKNKNHLGRGVNIMPVYMAKGLEFDVALIYDASDKNYNNEYDKNLLYIACTRALHKLSIYAYESMSRFIGNP